MNTNMHKYIYNIYYSNDVYNCERYKVIYENDEYIYVKCKLKRLMEIRKVKISDKFNAKDEHHQYNYNRYFYNVDQPFNSSDVTLIMRSEEINKMLMNAKMAMDKYHIQYNKSKQYYESLLEKYKGVK